MKNEPLANRILLDTKPLIKLFSKEDGWEDVEQILTDIENGKIEAAICVVTLTEVYYRYVHQKKADLAKTLVEELKHATYVRKLGINAEVAIAAGEFKGKHSIPISDALIAATAYLEGLTVITDDADFKKIVEIKTLTEKELLKQGV